MMAQPQNTTTDGLPKRFVFAMRTLFDIMDDQKTGLVRFSDIEHRWQDDTASGLPKGVLECLQKVTPPNGLLTFERFCAGLKICLLRNQVESQKTNPKPNMMDLTKSQPKRPPSAPLLDNQENIKQTPWNNTATVRPNNAISGQQRTTSMPQLHQERQDNLNYIEVEVRNYPPPPHHASQNSGTMLYGPPKPPRASVSYDKNPMVLQDRQHLDRNMDKTEIRNVLQNWHMGAMMNGAGRSSGDGKPSGHVDQQQAHKKVVSKRREPRRHTLQNGIDYNMLKRIKHMEQEKDVLMQGLTAVERARDWYLKQLTTVQDKMKYLGRVGSPIEQWNETHAEKLELQKARVLEVNRHLVALTESWERGGLPLHMNLAVNHVAPTDILSRIKHQNHLLTKEVSQKSDRITMLEQEKSSLLRELYQTRAVMQQQRQGEMMGFM